VKGPPLGNEALGEPVALGAGHDRRNEPDHRAASGARWLVPGDELEALSGQHHGPERRYASPEGAGDASLIHFDG
jgi:hypothetical protein